MPPKLNFDPRTPPKVPGKFLQWKTGGGCIFHTVLMHLSEQDLTVKPSSSLTHSCCFSSVLIWPSSSSSLCSFWHRCLCWARKRNTATLQNKINKERNTQGFREKITISDMNIKHRAVTVCYLWTHLLSSAFCRSMSSSKISLCSTKVSMFWRQSLSSSLEKRNMR